jgi:uncharacterized membrane protein
MCLGVRLTGSLIFLLSLVPTFESRYTIPLIIALTDIHPAVIFGVCVTLNVLVIPIVFIGLDLFVPPLSRRYGWIKSFFSWFIRRRLGRSWGLVGLAIFVMTPVPITGAYTGTLIAYLLGMKRLHAALAIAAGVITSGLLITLATLGIISLAGLFS